MIALKVAALNDLDILVCDIKGAYLTDECRKIVYTIAGAEFGSEEEVIMILKMVLYELKISGAAFIAKLGRVLHGLNYRPTKSDPDVWLGAGTKTVGTEYCEMDLCYVDKVLVIREHPKLTIECINHK